MQWSSQSLDLNMINIMDGYIQKLVVTNDNQLWNNWKP